MSLPPNLTSWTKQALRQYGLKAGQVRGQHFLIDREVLQSIITAAQLKPSDKVLEVGGGLGVLTLALLEQASAVVTVELESGLVKALIKLLPLSPNLKVLAGDILKITDEELCRALNLTAPDNFKIVADLPYDISGAFLRRFLSTSLPISQLVLLLQKEVAERLQPKAGQMSLLGLSAQLNGQVEIIRYVSPTSFYPPPKVTSALVKITLFTKAKTQQLLAGADEARLWQLAHIGFSAKRKMLKNNLLSAIHISAERLTEIFKALELNAKVRAQELSIEQWVGLARHLSK